ncbi:MAG: hypothetical protein EOP86_21805, partial [Verrucomicrobiaceae bacterium]
MKRHPRLSLHLRARILLAILPPLTASAQPAIVHTRFISIEKAGVATAFQALPGSGIPDSGLFESLMNDVAKGAARIAADQETINTSGQRAKVGAASYYPIPVEVNFGPAPGGGFVFPFQTDRLGQTLEMEATVSDGNAAGLEVRNIDLNLAPECRNLLQRQDCPTSVPDARISGVVGPVRLPLIAAQKTATQLLTWTGNTVLLSVSPGPADSLREGEPVFRYQFIRAGLDGEKPALPGPEWTGPGSPAVQARLHLITFRLPTSDAVSLTMDSGTRDDALFQRLRGMVDTATATFAGSSAVVVRNGQRSKVESFTEYPILIPSRGKKAVEWENFHMGDALETELSMSDEKYRVMRTEEGTQVEKYREDSQGKAALSWNIAYDRNNGLEEIPWHPGEGQASRPGVADVEFLRQNLSTQAVIPDSGVLCVGLVSHSPATLSSDAGPLPPIAAAAEDSAATLATQTENTVAEVSGSSPDSGGESSGIESMTDITFALQSPAADSAKSSGNPIAGGVMDSNSPTETAATQAGQVSYHAIMLSLPATEGLGLAASLKAAGGPLPATDWMARVRSGTIPCAAQAAVVCRLGGMGRASATRNFLEAFTPKAKPAASTSGVATTGPGTSGASSGPAATEPEWSAWTRAECGFQIEAEGSQVYGKDPDQLDVNLRLDWDTAPL